MQDSSLKACTLGRALNHWRRLLLGKDDEQLAVRHHVHAVQRR